MFKGKHAKKILDMVDEENDGIDYEDENNSSGEFISGLGNNTQK